MVGRAAASSAFPYGKLARGMLRRLRRAAAAGGVLLLSYSPSAAQTFEAAGARPAGMAGAFVAVADDASAVYWNPAGLAGGSYFSLVFDYNGAEAHDPEGPVSGSQSAMFLSAAMPALGLTYYRLRTSRVDDAFPVQPGAPVPLGPASRVTSLVTHHTGITLVQSLTEHIAIGTTLKLVRGIATAGFVAPGDREELLDEVDDVIGRGTTKFDADIGVIATFGSARVGFTARNVGDHEFESAGAGGSLTLPRQLRVGAAFTAATGLLLAADVDLRSVPGTTGLVRNVAAGGEARVLRRAAVRAGFRFNTRDDQPAGRAPVGTGGISYAAFGSVLLDGHVSWGGDSSDRGWGVGARVVF